MSLPPRDEPYIAELKAYLVQCPEIYDYRFNSKAKRDLRRALYRAASLSGRYIELFFPDIPDISETLFDGMDKESGGGGGGAGPASPSSNFSGMSEEPKQPFEWIMNQYIREQRVDPSHPGRTCSRKFKKGEPTYRCLYVVCFSTCSLHVLYIGEIGFIFNKDLRFRRNMRAVPVLF